VNVLGCWLAAFVLCSAFASLSRAADCGVTDEEFFTQLRSANDWHAIYAVFKAISQRAQMIEFMQTHTLLVLLTFLPKVGLISHNYRSSSVVTKHFEYSCTTILMPLRPRRIFSSSCATPKRTALQHSSDCVAMLRLGRKVH
jgi:hypothetical protein